MVAVADPKKRMSQRPPTDAKAFVIFSVSRGERAGGGKGGIRRRMTGPALEDGTVPDIWPISEFSTQKVLEMWGPGHYRVDFYDADDNLMRGQGYLFDVATPPGRSRTDRKLRPPPPDAPDIPIGAAAGPQGLGVLELITMLRAEREDADRRAQAQADRDRAHQTQQLEIMMRLLESRAQPTPAADPELLRQQLQLSVDRGMLGIRQELFHRQREDAENEEPDDEPDTEPPATIEEAASRIGVSFFSEIERNAPHLLRELVPTVVEWLKPRGFTPSATLQEQIARTLRARNGQGHADSE
jgi:hypothetical protein